ncbi:MAG: hypothetical protein H7X91_01295 [Burkholderiales bacterium]|nr:hypothetical protein [Burkholderiales bacterium]
MIALLASSAALGQTPHAAAQTAVPSAPAERSESSRHEAGVAIPVADPDWPEPDLPSSGRSLFDFLFAQETAYRITFPFSALVDDIETTLARNGPGMPALKLVLIPSGRSLQRDAAAPEFFKYPRVVAAVDSDPAWADGRSGMLLKDRLYLGYHEKAGVIEVISYNEAAGRFEFQIVKDYREGAAPRVVYASRTLCLSCHQNGGPIFARALWSETNANPAIAARLEKERRDFYGVTIERGVDVPNAIDDATDRANLLAVYQQLWRAACGSNTDAARACRAEWFALALRYALSGGHARRVDEPVFAKIWREKWPAGIPIPDPDLPNRDPLIHPHISARFEPLNPRPPLATWRGDRPANVEQAVAGIAGFLASSDIARIDAHLFATGSKFSARRKYQSRCRVTRGTRHRIAFDCREPAGAGLALSARIYAEPGKTVRGVVDRLALAGEEFVDLDLRGGEGGEDWGASAQRWLAPAYQSNSRLHARLADGNAIAAIAFDWADPGSAFATVEVLGDFAPLRAAISSLSTTANGTDVFSDQPFRRAVAMPALFRELGMPALDWCCVNDTGIADMVAARRDGGGQSKVAKIAIGGADPLFRFCAPCHQTPEPFPPNFLYGSAEQVAANLDSCAQRIFYRLHMWQMPLEARAKTPMPPEQALHALNFDPGDWKNSAELHGLKNAAAEILKSRSETPERVLASGYENLSPCLGDLPAGAR